MIEIIPNWHPIFVHFTVGLLSASVVFYLLSLLFPASDALKHNWRIVARWLLWSGMLVTIFTGIAGYLAYNSVAHDAPSHAAMTEHRNWAFATIATFVVLTAWSVFTHIKKRLPSMLFLLFAVISGGLLASTGWHGGEAVYRYGLGVMSLPTIEKDSDGGHGSHSHGNKKLEAESMTHTEKTDNAHQHSNTDDHSATSQPSLKPQSQTQSIPETKKSMEADHDNTPHDH